MNNNLIAITNTILSNFRSINNIGLISGKMGVTIYLYEFSRMAKIKYIECVADNLIDEIYSSVNSTTPSNIYNGIAGVGIGLAYLIREHFLCGTTDEVFCEIDIRMFDKYKQVILNDLVQDVPLFSTGLYCLCRVDIESDDDKKQFFVSKTKEAIELIADEFLTKEIRTNTSLLVSSILFVCDELEVKGFMIGETKNRIIEIFAENKSMDVYSIDESSQKVNEVWINMLLKKTVNLDTEYDIENMMQDFSYHKNEISQYFASIGLAILRKTLY